MNRDSINHSSNPTDKKHLEGKKEENVNVEVVADVVDILFYKNLLRSAKIHFFIEKLRIINIEVDTNLLPRKYLTE